MIMAQKFEDNHPLTAMSTHGNSIDIKFIEKTLGAALQQSRQFGDATQINPAFADEINNINGINGKASNRLLHAGRNYRFLNIS